MVRESLGQKNAVVVAHPDDECLWAGGLLARYAARDWTVIACSTPEGDALREPAFFAACHEFGAHGVLLPIPDRGVNVPLVGLEVLDDMLTGFDCVVTHGVHGEYGHPHHVQVYERVATASFEYNLLCFGWHKAGVGEHRIDLTPEEVAKKMAALACYSHIYDSLCSAYFVREGVPRDSETFDVG